MKEVAGQAFVTVPDGDGGFGPRAPAADDMRGRRQDGLKEIRIV